MKQYLLISIIGVVILAGLSAIVYFFGMKYLPPSSNTPCSKDNDCGREEYCSRGKCKSYNDCTDENRRFCANRNGGCHRISAGGGAQTCCSKSKVFVDWNGDNVDYCIDLEGDVLCDYDEQCKSGKCRSGRCTGSRLTASLCSEDYDCMSGICGAEGKCH